MTIILLLYKLKLNFSNFYHCATQFTVYMNIHVIHCKLSKCIGQTPCSFEHFLVIEVNFVNILNKHCIIIIYLAHFTRVIKQESRAVAYRLMPESF